VGTLKVVASAHHEIQPRGAADPNQGFRITTYASARGVNDSPATDLLKAVEFDSR
jgi:hypothetical protein